jgi:hypothetical protein
MRFNFKSPKHTTWLKVNGDVTSGLLTNNLELVPQEVHPKSETVTKRGYRKLFCLQRNRWVALWTKNILTVTQP